jgi:dipeptidyl aminopeptidase/acylaminoacyl peptidase
MAGLEVGDLAEISEIAEASISPDGGTVVCCVAGIDPELDRVTSQLRLVPVARTTGAAPELAPLLGRAPRWAPDGSAIALLAEAVGETELRTVAVTGGKGRALASFHRCAGPPAWSPTGERIAIAVETAGTGTRIAVIEAATGAVEIVPGLDGEEDSAPTWAPDSERLAFARGGRPDRDTSPRSSLQVVRVGGGEHPRRVPTDLAFATCPSWSPRGELLACIGTREPRLGGQDPCLQPWVLPASGGAARLAANGVNGIVAGPPPEGPLWSADGSTLFFREARAGDIDLVSVGLACSENRRALTSGCQVTSVGAATAAERVAYTTCSSADAGSLHVHDQRGARLTLQVDGRSPLRESPAVVRRRFASPHGHALDGWLQGLDESRSPQPLVVCPHGGPHSFVGSGSQLGHFYRAVLASRGWIVLTLNTSGSGSYGEAFADAIRGRWGEYDLPEHLAAIDSLVEEDLADPERLAIAGYSYGGYMAAWAIAHTDRFRAAAIGAPIANLVSFAEGSDIGGWYSAWELPADRERFEALSPVSHAERIATPALILHGEADRRCPIGQSEELHARLLEVGRAAVELVRYPGADHLFYAQGRPSQRLDYNRRIVEWLERWVLGDVKPT